MDMRRPGSTMAGASRRGPRKICGLFDSGLAGGAFDVTSFGYDASIGSLENVISADVPLFDAYAENKLDALMTTSHIPDQLSDILVDQLANHNLDAFINLDQYLQDLFFDDIIDANPAEAIPTHDMMIPTSTESNIFHQQAPTSSEQYIDKSLDPFIFKPVTTSVFEIPEHESMVSDPPQANYWTGEFENVSTTSEMWKHTTHENGQRTSISESALSSSDSSTCSSDILDSHKQEIITDKTTAKRNKNKDTSQKSGERRKPKLSDLDDEAVRLVEENEKLRQKIKELEEMTKKMKAQLISSIVGN